MSLNFLICPQCQCSLNPPSGQSTGMSCPRCNTWLEIDPKCSGSCLACHKVNSNQTLSTETGACVELSATGESGKCGESTANVVQRKVMSLASNTGRSVLALWKTVFR